MTLHTDNPCHPTDDVAWALGPFHRNSSATKASMAQKRVPPEVYWKQKYLESRKYDSKTWAAKKNTRRAEGRFYDRKNPQAKAAYYKSKVKKDGKTPGYISKGGSAAGGAAGTYLGGAMGGPVGGALGGAVGSFLGGKIGHLVEQITGFGDYKVVSNSIMSGGVSPPSIVNSANKGGVIVRHREYIGDILATTGFTLQQFSLNPGLLQTFPWFSQMAMAYEQYRMRGALFEFLSTSSDALLSTATSTALGTVNMATLYDVTDAPFSDKRTMLNHEWSNSRKPSVSFIHPIECKASYNPNNLYYTRAAGVPPGADPARFDFCKFCIATEGMQAAGGVLGELWITYEIELFKQQYHPLVYTDHFRLTGVAAATPLGTGTDLVNAANVARGGTLGGSINTAGTIYSFPANVGSGLYLVQYQAAGVLGPLTGTGIVLTNCAYAPIMQNGLTGTNANAGTTSPIYIHIMYVRVLAQGATIQWGVVGVFPTGALYSDLTITQMSTALV